MNVLSLFDGISCCRVALDRAGLKVNKYYASEIDKNAIKVAMKNYPDTIQLGSVKDIIEPPDTIDLLVGGSPCTDLSIAKKNREGLEGTHSSLFWEYVRIKNEFKPKWFILENVASMPKADKDIITREMGVEPILINASLVSAQSRKRLFWTNIPNVVQPEDKNVLLKDILQPDAEVDDRFTINGKSFCLTASYSKTSREPKEKEAQHEADKKQRTLVKIGHIGKEAQATRVYSAEGKSATLSANGGGLGAKTGLYLKDEKIRKLTPIECERLQGLSDNYTEGIALTNRYKALGNAFNVDVVSHILSTLASNV